MRESESPLSKKAPDLELNGMMALSERNLTDAYTGMLDNSAYQPFVFPVSG
jgi:hypothetical protein